MTTIIEPADVPAMRRHKWFGPTAPNKFRVDTSWHERAKCVGRPEFTEDRSSSVPKRLKDVCLSCPVIEQCRKQAKETRAFGVIMAGKYQGYDNLSGQKRK